MLVVMERAKDSMFEDLILSSNMYADHFPGMYEKKLKKLLDSANSSANDSRSVDQFLFDS